MLAYGRHIVLLLAARRTDKFGIFGRYYLYWLRSSFWQWHELTMNTPPMLSKGSKVGLSFAAEGTVHRASESCKGFGRLLLVLRLLLPNAVGLGGMKDSVRSSEADADSKVGVDAMSTNSCAYIGGGSV